MAYFGKLFVLESQDKFKEFLDSFGDKIPDQMKPVILNHKATAKLTKSGDEYVFVTSQPTGGEKTTTFKSGVEFDSDLAGNKAKTTITMDGDTMDTVMNFDNGITFNIKRVFSENQFVATVNATGTDITATRIYKA